MHTHTTPVQAAYATGLKQQAGHQTAQEAIAQVLGS